jgi:hypothetical protein
MYFKKKRKNLSPVVESQFSETFTWGFMGNRKISNIFGDYCIGQGRVPCLVPIFFAITVPSFSEN